MKQFSRIIFGALIGAFAGIAIQYLFFAPQEAKQENAFRKVGWGMSKEQVKAAERSLHIASESPRSLLYKKQMHQFLNQKQESLLTYYFSDNKLTAACYNLNPNQELEPSQEVLALYKQIEQKLSDKHGPPQLLSEEKRSHAPSFGLFLLNEWRGSVLISLQLLKVTADSPYGFELCYRPER